MYSRIRDLLMRMILPAAILVTLVSSCSNDHDSSNDEDKNTYAEKSRMFSGQFQALDKAEQVEQILQDGQENLDKSIEEQAQ